MFTIASRSFAVALVALTGVAACVLVDNPRPATPGSGGSAAGGSATAVSPAPTPEDAGATPPAAADAATPEPAPVAVADGGQRPCVSMCMRGLHHDPSCNCVPDADASAGSTPPQVACSSMCINGTHHDATCACVPNGPTPMPPVPVPH